MNTQCIEYGEIKNIFSQFSGIALILDSSARWVWGNEFLCRLFHVTNEECQERSLFELTKVYGFLFEQLDGWYRRNNIASFEKDREIEDVSFYIHGSKRLYFATHTKYFEDSVNKRKCVLLVGMDITKDKEHNEELLQKENSLSHAQELVHLGYWEWIPSSMTLTWSDHLYRILGYERKEITPSFRSFYSRIHVEDRLYVAHLLDHLLRGGEIRENSENEGFKIVTPDGEQKIIASKTKAFYENGELSRVIGVLLDISEEKKREKDLQIALAVMKHTLEGIVVTDVHATIKSVNPAFTTITGYEAHEAIGKNPRILKSQKHPREFYVNFWKELIEKGYWEGEIWNRRKSGEVYPEWLSVAAVYDGNGKISEYISVFSDLSEMKTKDAQIRLKSLYDQLTGLPNKIMFLDRLDRELKNIEQKGFFAGVLFLDINRFKNVNESLGHFSGDQLLQQVAQRLQKTVGESNTVARIGGDDYYILIHQAQRVADIAHMARALLHCFKEPFHLAERPIFLTARIGIAIAPDDGTTTEVLLQKADIALHKARETGLNSYEFFKEELGERASYRLLLENDLRESLLNKNFVLFYQPQLQLKTGMINGFESLVRWQHPQKGLIMPSYFIPVAEETGLILPLGEEILMMACRHQQEWKKQGNPPLEISVNISTRQLLQENFISEVRRILEAYSIKPGEIGFEITESGVMRNVDASLDLLREMKILGCRIYMDDFGTGYSSLAYLSQFPIDVIKVDKSFIDGIGIDRRKEVLVKTMVNMAHSLGLGTIAEGVETHEQLDFLKDINCDAIQGYVTSKPLEEKELVSFIINNTI